MEMKNGVLKSDYDALVALYNSTKGRQWTHNTGWLTEAPVSEWYGIKVKDGRVTHIDLTFNHLNGSIPPKICNLDMLTGLYLYQNRLKGWIPESVSLNYCTIMI